MSNSPGSEGSEQFHSISFLPVKLIATLLFVLLTYASFAAAQTSQLSNLNAGCGADYLGQTWDCNSSDIAISEITGIQIEGNPTNCVAGQPLLIQQATVSYSINRQKVYDQTMYIADQQGTDPRLFAGPGQSCSAFSLPGPFAATPSVANPWTDLDGDACGDSGASVSSASREFTNVPVTCQDNDGDGKLDFQVLLTWDINAGAACGQGPGQQFPTGGSSRSKCDYSLRGTDVGVVPPGTLTVVKETNGGDDAFLFEWGRAANPTETEVFTLDTSTGPGTAQRTFQVVNGLGQSDFIVGEVLSAQQLADGWTFESAECVDQDENPVGSPVDPSPDANGVVNITIDSGDEITCTFVNNAPASLTVVKNTLGGNGVFEFSSDVPGLTDFPLDTGDVNTAQTPAIDNIPINDPVNGEPFTITEIVPEGWQLVSASCTNGDSSMTESLDVTLRPGDDVTCTFIDSLNASVTILKQTQGGNGSFDFTTTLPGVTNGQFNITTTNNSGAFALSETVPAGSYTVTETVPAGWDLTGLSCVESGIEDSSTDLGAATATLNLEPGETVTCTYVDSERGQIVVDKVTNPSGSDQSFNFTLTGTGVSQTFALTDAATPHNSGYLLPGTYSLDETPLQGWDLLTATCDDGSDPSAIDLAPGETVTCMFTNTQRGSITIVKTVSADGPVDSDFDFSSDIPGFESFTLGGVTAVDPGAVTMPNLVPGTYNVSEDGPPAGWALTGESCNDGSNPSAIDLAPGEDVVCNFVNSPLGSATIIKFTVGDDDTFNYVGSDPFGGLSLMTTDGVDTADFGFELDPANNPYTITEDPLPAGWSLTDLGCVEDGIPPDSTEDLATRTATINVDFGEQVTCTFTNTAGSALVIGKVTDPAGDTDNFTFEGDVAGSITDGQTLEAAGQPGIYTSTEVLSESPGWQLVDIQCVGVINSVVEYGTQGLDNFDGDFDVGDDTVWVLLAAGEVVQCDFVNEKEGSITIVKETAGGNGTFAFGGDFGTFQIDTAVDNDEAFTGLLGGTYLVSETVPTGWGLTDIFCTGATNSIVTIGGSGDFDSGDNSVTVQLEDGEDIDCTFVNTALGSITVEKTTDPSGSNVTFGFTGDVAGELADGGSLTTLNLLPGEYTSTEVDVPGWDLTDISCNDSDSSGDTNARTATFRLSAGEDVTCTFINTVQRGQIVVDKVTDPSDAAQSFDFTLTGTGVSQTFALTDAATPHNSGDLLPSSENGPYSVVETLVQGWDLLTATCDDGSDPSAIDLAPGEVVTCTFQNAVEASRIIVNKETDPAGSTQPFDFTLTGGGNTVNFQLTGPGVPFNSGELLPTSEAGTYSVAEAAVNGWDLTSATCSDGSPVDAIDVAAGETVTCTFSNTIQRGAIVVDKVTDPSGSTRSFDFTLIGTGVSQSFALTDAATPYSSGPLLPTSESGTYNVAEATVNGWDLTGATCSDGSNPAAIDLAPGETVTCTFTNTIQRGAIQVDKVTDPSGSSQSFDFTLSGTDVNQSFALTDAAAPHDSGELLPSLENGTYAVTESEVSGWDLTSVVCSNGDSPDAISVAPGATVTCMFTNTVQPGQIVVDKITDPSGSDQSFDFTLGGTGVSQSFALTDAATPYSSGDLPPSSEVGTYSVAEAAVDGWDLTSATCNDGSDPAAIDLAPGETVTCTFTNTLQSGVAPKPAINVPVNRTWALIMMLISILGIGWYFLPAVRREP